MRMILRHPDFLSLIIVRNEKPEKGDAERVFDLLMSRYTLDDVTKGNIVKYLKYWVN